DGGPRECEPSGSVHELTMLGAVERDRALFAFNDTTRDWPPGGLIHHLFEEQAANGGGSIAVVHEGKGLTYGSLNERANRLARYLRKKGVGPDTLVAVCVERSLDMIVGLLGVLKAGGAYIPLDPSYPRERLADMLDDASPKLVLT